MIVSESYRVDISHPDFVLIEYTGVLDTAAGLLDERRSLWLERQTVPLLVAAIKSFLATSRSPTACVVRGRDRLEVFERGPDQAPYVHLDNDRPTSAPHGGYHSFAMSKPIAHKLVDELAMVVRQS